MMQKMLASCGVEQSERTYRQHTQDVEQWIRLFPLFFHLPRLFVENVDINLRLFSFEFREAFDDLLLADIYPLQVYASGLENPAT
jgi:hypothetical protein